MSNLALVTPDNDQSLNNNLATLHHELDWLKQVIDQVICSYLKQEGHEEHWFDIVPPDLATQSSVYANLVALWQLSNIDRIAIALGLAPHLRPELLDIFFGVNGLIDRPFTEFGGAIDKNQVGFLPTVQTFYFLISANDPAWRLDAVAALDTSHYIIKERLLILGSIDTCAAQSSATLILADQWLDYFLSGEKVRPEQSPSFPAHPMTTALNWQDLVLDYPVMTQIEEINTWLTHGEFLMQQCGLAKKIKPGYRALFFGPPGTGKTLTAALLAKATGREIYRVDLSMIVSKYIGETEKNLSRLFDAASNKQWILFFDEADSLFGKRTQTSSSNDRHANQQTGYLLQRIEEFPGMVILASNLKANMDEAFTRRFQSMVQFTMPEPEQRLQLWQKAFANTLPLNADVDLTSIAQQYELAGGAIINVLRHCAMAAVNRTEAVIIQQDILCGIRKEYRKDNRTL